MAPGHQDQNEGEAAAADNRLFEAFLASSLLIVQLGWFAALVYLGFRLL